MRGQAPLLGAACALHTGRRRRGAWPRSMETNGIAPTHPHGPRARRHAQPHASAHHGPNAATARALDEVSGSSAVARPALAPGGDRHHDGGSARGGWGGVCGARGVWRAAITEPSAAPLLAALPGGRGAALRFAGCERPATGGGGGACIYAWGSSVWRRLTVLFVMAVGGGGGGQSRAATVRRGCVCRWGREGGLLAGWGGEGKRTNMAARYRRGEGERRTSLRHETALPPPHRKSARSAALWLSLSARATLRAPAATRPLLRYVPP